MGWLFTRATDPEFQDISYLTQWPIETFAQSFMSLRKSPVRPKDIRTILYRMAYLIYFRSKSNPAWQSVMIAKWYLANLDKVLLTSDEEHLAENFVNQLRRHMAAFESMHGPVATHEFDRLVQLGGSRWDQIVYGNPLFAILEPASGNPRSDLSKMVSWYGWRQNAVENSRL